MSSPISMHGWRTTAMLGLQLCALVTGCSHRQSPEQAELIADIERLGGRVKFDEHHVATEVALGGTQVSGAVLARLSLFPELKTLSLFDSTVGDDDFAQMAGLGSLETLYLGRTRITDAALADVARFKSLQTLGLSDTRISDEGIQCLAALSKLRSVDLHRTRVTAAGVDALKSALPQIVIHF